VPPALLVSPALLVPPRADAPAAIPAAPDALGGASFELELQALTNTPAKPSTNPSPLLGLRIETEYAGNPLNAKMTGSTGRSPTTR
jgi:hypothetical protein